MNKLQCIDCGCALYPLQVTNNVGARRTDWICPICGGGVVDGPAADQEGE